MIKEVSNIHDVVNGSFGWRNPSQILLCRQDNPFDYTELTQYFLTLNNTARGDQTIITMDQLGDAMSNLILSEQGLASAHKLYQDISEIRALTDKVGLYAQNIEHHNAASQWHYDKNERTILAKYNGVATQLSLTEHVLGHKDSSDPHSAFILCDVPHDSKAMEMENGSIFAITGTDRFFGRPTAHRKAPLNGEPRLILIAEP